MKKHQLPMTVEEQINNLKSIGLIISDNEYAAKILNEVSYFRLVKAYSLGLKKDGIYKSGVSFEDIVELYMFNADFRHLLFAQIERIEVGLRCQIANYFSGKYGIFGYRDMENFENKIAQRRLLSEIEKEIQRNRKAPFIKNFQENYETGNIPFYAVVEVLSFGTLSKCYKNMKNADKKEIAKEYNINFKYLQSWVESISYVRNICAHYGRLYNATLSKAPQLYKQYASIGINNRTIFSILICMKYILKDDDVWKTFIEDLSILISQYPKIHISKLGFTENWRELIE